MTHEKDAVGGVGIAVAAGGMAAGVNSTNERDAGNLVFRRIFAAPVAELFGRPIEEPKFTGIAGVDDGFTAEGLGGGGELLVLLFQVIDLSPPWNPV